jgi:hypothetical protein
LRVLEDLLARMMRLQRAGLNLPPRAPETPEAQAAKPFRYRFKRAR